MSRPSEPALIQAHDLLVRAGHDRGARRGVRSVGGVLAYLSCHRRRAGLMPA